MSRRLATCIWLAFCQTACSSPPSPPAEGSAPSGGTATALPAIQKLAVLAFPGEIEPAQAVPVLEALSQGIEQKHKLEVLYGPSLQQAVWGGKEGPPRQCLEAFAASLAEGRKALERFQLAVAGERLQRARSQMDTCGAYLEQEQLVGLFVALGHWLAVREQREEALSAFRQAVVFSPRAEARSVGLADRPASIFEEARRAVLSGNTHPLAVGSWPPGATVFVDGLRRGVTPLEGIALYSGVHFLRLELAGHSSWTRVLPDEVPPDKLEVRLMPFFNSERLLGMARELTEGQPGAEGVREAAELASALEVDGLLLLSFHREKEQLELVLRLFFAAGAVFSTPQRFSLGGGEKAWVATARGLAGALRDLKAATGSQNTVKRKGKSKKKKSR